ncbi:hypothetical protein OC834_002706 [Tilletia horrida]|nr:hypothetical protein OC834_002706 [Tilletia horrida]
MSASLLYLVLTLAILAHLPASSLAQSSAATSTSTTTSGGTATTSESGPHHTGHHDGPSKAKADKNETDKATAEILPLAPLNIPEFFQCEPATINATASVNPAMNAHDLTVQVTYPNGTDYFTETVRGSGKKPVPNPFVWVWPAVDLEAGTQFLLSVNQTSGGRKSSKDKTPRELVLLPPTNYTVGASATNQTACLQEAADTNHRGRRHREQQRGQNEVRIIGAVIGSFVFILLLLIGLMAYRRRREAKRSAASGNVDDDDLDDFSSNRGRAPGTGWGDSEMSSSNAHPSQPQRRNMERAPGWKYMSRVVGGHLESDEPANSSSVNLYDHTSGDGYGYRPASRAGGPNLNPSDPFGNHHQAPMLQVHSPSPTAELDYQPAFQSDRDHSSPMIPLNRLGQEGGIPAVAPVATPGARRTEVQGEDALPSYRESAAGRRKSAKKGGRLGADGRVQEGVVVRARPPQYQDEWRAKDGGGDGDGDMEAGRYGREAEERDGPYLSYRQ